MEICLKSKEAKKEVLPVVLADSINIDSYELLHYNTEKIISCP